jgi:5-methylcytosine-specific restriction endonuclease McrA
MIGYILNIDDSHIKKEKEAARRLRRTNWWYAKIEPGICHYCRRNVGREQLTMDHVVPLTRGGRSKKGNLVPACKECNNRKKSLLPVEWDEYLRSLGGGVDAKED